MMRLRSYHPATPRAADFMCLAWRGARGERVWSQAWRSARVVERVMGTAVLVLYTLGPVATSQEQRHSLRAGIEAHHEGQWEREIVWSG
jgi:hypothetical protein